MRIGITLTSSLDVDQKYIDLTDSVAKTLASKNLGIVYGGTAYGMMKRLAESYKGAGGKDLCGIFAKDLISVTKNYEMFVGLDEEYVVETIEERKKKIISLSDAYLILPGGWGTFEEIGSILGGQANKLYSKPIAFYNFENYYNTLFSFLNDMYKQKFSRVNLREVFFTSNNFDEILHYFESYSAVELKDKFV